VSKFSYRSFKEVDVGRRNTFYVLLAAAAAIGIIAINPNVVLFAGFLVYALSGPVAHFVVFDKKKPLKVRTRSRRLTVVDSKPVSHVS
jgi:CDP-diacylglycerol--serine O-phosphatidyltransferase